MDRKPAEPRTPTAEELRELARWIQAQPWNAPGTDKSWVFRTLRSMRDYVRSVERIDAIRARMK